MTILITRPREDAAATAQLIQQRGLTALVEPMMQMVFTPEELTPLDGIVGILATSANGVRAFAQATPRRDLPLWAVGDATARTAGELGFATIHSAGGDVESLAALVMAHQAPEDGPLLHVTGSEVAGDLSGLLTQEGYTVRRIMLYHTIDAKAFTTETLAALAQDQIRAVLFYSPRTAQIFVNVLAKTEIPATLSRIWAVALSPAVAQRLQHLPWAGVKVAESPTQTALLAALDGISLPADQD